MLRTFYRFYYVHALIEMPTLLSLRTPAVALLLLILVTAVVAAEKKAKPVLTPDQRAKANKLLAEYRAAGANQEKKEEICRKVLEISPAAAPLMLTAVDRELQPKMRKYNTRFQGQAASIAKRKMAKVDLNRVAQLRQTVLDLPKLGEGFTHAVIAEKADPAMARLRAAFILERNEVLDNSTDLQGERKKLVEVGRLWEKCQVALPSENAGKAVPITFESYLQDEENLAAWLAVPMDPKTRSVLAMNAKLAEKLDPEEARAILELNLARNLLGLSALAIDLDLCAAARGHSADMQELKFFSHESPVQGKTKPGDRAKLAGTTASAENIFMGSANGKAAHESWFHSPGHHRNQMGKHARVGVGRAGTYFTQMFGD